MQPDRGLPARSATLLCAKHPAAGGIQLTTFAAYRAARRGTISHPCQCSHHHWPELTRETETAHKPSGAAASLTLCLALGCSCGGAIPPKQQMPHHSSKPQGLFQTLPGLSPVTIRCIVPSCNLSCFVQAGDRSQAAQPSNTAM